MFETVPWSIAGLSTSSGTLITGFSDCNFARHVKSQGRVSGIGRSVGKGKLVEGESCALFTTAVFGEG